MHDRLTGVLHSGIIHRWLLVFMWLWLVVPPTSMVQGQDLARSARQVPSGACNPLINVLSDADSGVGTLRQAVADVCDAGTIVFDASVGPIYLDSTINLSRTVTIDGANFTGVLSGDSGNDNTKNTQIFSIASTAVVTLTHLTLQDAQATDGGAIFLNQGTLTILDSTFQNNTAGGSGGAIFNNAGQLYIERTTFIGNQTAFNGGAINTEASVDVINNSTFINNTVTNGSGGGILGLSANITVRHSTFYENSASSGGTAVYQIEGSMVLHNSILASSILGNDCSGATIGSTTLIEDGSCNATLTGDPFLADMGNYGGATQTLGLLPDSLALDAADANQCLATDQRGINRPVGAACDLGAFESQGFNITITGGNNQTTPISTTFGQALEVSVISNDAVPVVGSVISFTAPLSGASLDPQVLTATVSVNNTASVSATANSIVGMYGVEVGFNSDSALATFSLTNCMSSIVVTNAQDSSAGSLRDALDSICSNGVITFDNDYTIYLNSTLTFSRNLTLDGTGHEIVLSGDSGNDGTRDVRPVIIAATATVTIDHVQIVSGTADIGAGIRNFGTLRVVNSVVEDNIAVGDGSRGGGIYSNNTLFIGSSTIRNNSAEVGGGVATDLPSSFLVFRDAAVVHNSAEVGGGVYVLTGTILLLNSTVGHNVAAQTAGGIYSEGIFGMSSSTIAANEAPTHSGISTSSVDMTNSLIADNVNGDCTQTSGELEVTNTWIEDGSCNSTFSGDPNLAPLDFYGGSTPLFGLLPSSLARNVVVGADCIPDDQRGLPRLLDGLCDLGAFETQGFEVELISGGDQATGTNMMFPVPVVAQIVAHNSLDPVGPGIVITLTSPLSGAGFLTPVVTGTTDVHGFITATVTANNIAGSYPVMVTAEGITETLSFTLTNIQVYSLTVVLSGTGSGSVTSAPAGIECRVTCSAGFLETEVVTLTATPDAGSVFTGWSGVCSGTGECVVPMDQVQEVIATFDNNLWMLYLPIVRKP